MDQTQLNEFIRKQRQIREASSLPLKDIRVIDLASVLAAPFAANLLGDYGAEVIKIEPPNVPDAIRFWSQVEGKYQPYWLVNARNKLPITLNLKHPEGIKIFSRLIEMSDVLLENMRPGTLDRLGFTGQNLLKLNPGLIIGHLSGFGQTGPYAAKPGFGTLAEAMSGFSHLNAHPGGPPTSPPIALADCLAGVHLAFAVMIALRQQKRGERGGQEIDISLYEPLFGLMGGEFALYSITGKGPEPMGNEMQFTAPRNSFKTSDGKWVAFSASAQAPYERLMELVGHPELKTAPGFRTNAERIQKESRAVLNRVISQWIGSKTRAEVLEVCEKAGVTIGPIYDMEEIAHDPHVKARGSIREVYAPHLERNVGMPNLPFHFSKTPGAIRFPGLPLGAANEVVLQDLLRHSPQEVAELKAKGAL